MPTYEKPGCEPETVIPKSKTFHFVELVALLGPYYVVLKLPDGMGLAVSPDWRNAASGLNVSGTKAFGSPVHGPSLLAPIGLLCLS